MKKMKSLSICLLLFSGIVNAEVKQLEIIMDFSQYPYYIPENYSYEFNYTYTSIDGNPFFDYEKNGVKLPITGLTCDALKMCIGYVSVDFNNQSAIYASVNGVGDSNIRSSNSDELMVINAKLYFSFDYSPVLTDPNGTYVVSFEDGIAQAESMQPIYEGNYYSGGVVTTPSAAGSLVSNPAVKGSGSYNVVLDSGGKILEVVFVANSAPTIALTATSSSYVQGSPVTINAVVSDREKDAVIGCSWSLDGVLTGGTSCTQFISSTLLLGDHNIRLAVKYKNVSDQEVEIFSDVAVNIFKAPQMSVPSSVVFTCTKGDGLLTGIPLTPTNIGGGTYNWSLNTPSATWLKASPNSGIVGVPFNLTANCTGLLAGTYVGNVTVKSTDSTNSAVNVVATLTVKEALSGRLLELGPSQIWSNEGPKPYISTTSGKYCMAGHNYFQKEGGISDDGGLFIINSSTRYMNIRLYFSEPSVFLIQYRYSPVAWIRYFVSSYSQSSTSHGIHTGKFMTWPSDRIANKEKLLVGTGELNLAIDLFDITGNGGTLYGLSLSVADSDPVVCFDNAVFTAAPLPGYSSTWTNPK